MKYRVLFLSLIIASLIFSCGGTKNKKKRYLQFIGNYFDTSKTYCYNDGVGNVVFYFSHLDPDSCVLNYSNYRNQALAEYEAYSFHEVNKVVPAFFQNIYESWTRDIIPLNSVMDISNNTGEINVFSTTNSFEFDVIEQPRFKQKVFDSVNVLDDVQYGEARGFWKSLKYQGKEELNVILEKLELVFSAKKKLKLNLDIYEPYNDNNSSRPIIVFFHDGAFWAGDKADETAVGLGNYFAKHGYVFVSADYRLGFTTLPSIFKLPNQLDRSGYQAIQDGRAALRFLVHHADTYKIDTSKIFLAGASAGSILALNVAFMENEEKPESAGNNFWIGGDNYLFPDLGCLDCSTNDLADTFKVKGVINMWGAVSDTSIINEPIPVLSFHGDKDKIVPFGHEYPYNKFKVGINRYFSSLVYGSNFINKQLNKLNIPNRLVIFKDYMHSPHLDDNNEFNSNFDTILFHSRNFYYELLKEEIAIKGNKIINDEMSIQPYSIEPIKNKSIAWQVNGGRILGCSENKSKVWVQWFSTVAERKLSIKIASQYDIVSMDSMLIDIKSQ